MKKQYKPFTPIHPETIYQTQSMGSILIQELSREVGVTPNWPQPPLANSIYYPLIGKLNQQIPIEFRPHLDPPRPIFHI